MRVFISYSHDSDEHKQRIVDLAHRLRGEGVDAWIDRYEVSPPEGWPVWMLRQIDAADFVLVFCSETYCRRFEGREAEGVGAGARYEGVIITQTLYEASLMNRKFIPLLADDDEVRKAIPRILRGVTCYRFPSRYDELLRGLAGIPEVVPPPLGGPGGGAAESPAPPLEVPDIRSEGAVPALLNLRILVVDDLPFWRQALRRTLGELGDGIAIDLAESLRTARQLLHLQRYDLAVVDRALLGEPASPEQADNHGMELLDDLRRSPLNRQCAALVVTGYSDEHVNSQAYRKYKVYQVLQKGGPQGFDTDKFLAEARAAVLFARLGALPQRKQSAALTLSFDAGNLVGSTLTGLRQRAYRVDLPFEGSDLADRIDAVTPGIETGEIREIGGLLHRRLAADDRVFEGLFAHEELSDPPDTAAVGFEGPDSLLATPFELLQDESGPWALQRPLSRRLVLPYHESNKPETFALLVEKLLQDGQPLRILLVAGTGTELTEAYGQEVEELSQEIGQDLKQLGLPHKITELTGAKATTSLVELALQDHHVLHYAGPAGLTLREGGRPKALAATDLGKLLNRPALYLAFLSGGLRHPGFPGFLAEMVKADVPAILAHRWPLPDAESRRLAKAFYRALWQTFSPGQALLAARRVCAGSPGESGADWASPLLILQNA